jgi:hypothetical protein
VQAGGDVVVFEIREFAASSNPQTLNQKSEQEQPGENLRLADGEIGEQGQEENLTETEARRKSRAGLAANLREWTRMDADFGIGSAEAPGDLVIG